MSTGQQGSLDAVLRRSAFPVGSDVEVQWHLLREVMPARPLPAEVAVKSAELGGVPVAEITVGGVEPRHVVLYFHGGIYVWGGDALSSAGPASQVGRRAGAEVVSVDCRLAPGHPCPAAMDGALAACEALLKDGVAASDIVLAGRSSGQTWPVLCLVSKRFGAWTSGSRSPAASSATTGMNPFGLRRWLVPGPAQKDRPGRTHWT